MPTNEELEGMLLAMRTEMTGLRTRIAELEDFAQTHIGLDWGTAGTSVHMSHPNLSVDTVEAAGGIIRLDYNGIQIYAPTNVPAIYWLVDFSADPLNTYPHGTATGFGTATNAKASVEAAYTSTDFARAQATSGAVDGSRMTLTATNGTEQAIVTLRGANKSGESLGVTDLFSSLSFSNPVSVSITANQNDWNPTGNYGTVSFRVTTDASRDITGITNGRPGNGGGRLLFIMNAGSFDLVLKDESASSTAANRLALKADITIAPDGGAALLYDVLSSRWRCVGSY